MGIVLFKSYLRPRLLIALMAVLGLGLGAVYGASLLQANHAKMVEPNNGFEVPLPSNMDKFVQDADVIVIGKVGSIVNQGRFWGYDIGAQERSSAPKDQLSGALPITDYQIEVEQVLLADSTITAGKPLLLRVIQGPTDKDAYAGTHRLFFLSVNPDNATYGLHYGFTSQIILDGSIVTDGVGRSVPFAAQLNSTQFLDRVKNSIAKTKGISK